MPDLTPSQPGRLRARRLAAGWSAGLLGHIVQAVGQVLTVPLFLRSWGPHTYGEWLSASAVLAHANLPNACIQPYVVNLLTRLRARRRQRAFRRLLHAALRLQLLMTLAPVAAALPLLFLLTTADAGLENVGGAPVVALLALSVAVGYPGGIVSGLYRALGEYARGQSIWNVSRCAHFGLVCLGLLVGGTPLFVAGLQIIPGVVAPIAAFIDLSRRHRPYLARCRPYSTRTMARLAWRSAGFVGLPMAALAQGAGALVLLRLSAGPTAVVVYSTCRTLVNVGRQTITTLTNAAGPELTTLASVRDGRTAGALIARLEQLALVVALVSTVAIMGFADVILDPWTRGAVSYDAVVLSGLCVGLIAGAMGAPAAGLLGATNRAGLLSLAVTAPALIALLAMALVSSQAGWEWGTAALAVSDIGTWIAARRLASGALSSMGMRLEGTLRVRMTWSGLVAGGVTTLVLCLAMWRGEPLDHASASIAVAVTLCTALHWASRRNAAGTGGPESPRVG